MFDTSVGPLEKSIAFLEEIGIPVHHKKLTDACFLPGLSIENGSIIIDKDILKYPGDILHEAGHIAVVPSEERKTLSAFTIEKRKDRAAEEIMAIAWSYAACIHLAIDPAFVFHDDGYKGGGTHLAEIYNEKKFIGLPMLQWIGLAADEKNAAMLGIQPFPSMIRWMRD